MLLFVPVQVAAGSFSNLYRGSYCGQEVAVKILKELQDDASQYQEFLQEVSIMRKVRGGLGSNRAGAGYQSLGSSNSSTTCCRYEQAV
jgi:hypothetical protein